MGWNSVKVKMEDYMSIENYLKGHATPVAEGGYHHKDSTILLSKGEIEVFSSSRNLAEKALEELQFENKFFK